ncbi:MAG TPA: hypothetical protein VMU14_17985 [Acidimicrobiales bacterium]|nr:hypothetical protein [Acidimicrobiales bacterium]
MSTITCFEGLSLAEMEAECAVQLPARHLMSLININVVNAINLSAALNVLSEGSSATSAALQGFSIAQF